jgi:hypothetical protein
MAGFGPQHGHQIDFLPLIAVQMRTEQQATQEIRAVSSQRRLSHCMSWPILKICKNLVALVSEQYQPGQDD